ncbi:MAG: hypothetical protein JKY37_04240 [Nannocystaceae bacterium]|nr:hypothetical protein [Nannocystaceae bacterium]
MDPPAPPSNEAIGTESATAYIASAANGHWVAFCQAREDTDDTPGIQVHLGRHGDLYGDAMVPYLAVGAGEGVPLKAFVGSDPSGRFVAVVRDGDGLVLLDTWASDEWVLSGAQTDDDASPFGHHRAAVFSADKVAFARETGDRTYVVVRDLRAGTELVLDPGDGILWRFDLDAAQQNVVVRMLLQDTDGDGAVTPPVPKTSLAGRQCRGPVGSYSRSGATGDRPVVRTIALQAGASPRDVPGALAMLARGPLARRGDGAIVSGATEVLSAKCQAEIIHVEPLKNEVWATCKTEAAETSAGKRMSPLLHVLGTNVVDVGLHVELHGYDRIEQPLGLVQAYDGATMKTINTRTATTSTAVLGRGSPAMVDGDRLLYLPGRKAFIYDLSTERRRQIKALGDGFIYVTQGTVAAVLTGRRTTVFDLATSEVLGRTKAEAMAVATSGHVLVAKRSNGAVRKLPVGPLRWYPPK